MVHRSGPPGLAAPPRVSGQPDLLEKSCNRRESFVTLLEHSRKEIEAVRHPLADKMLDLRRAGRAQRRRLP
jgi:hypothetical protein